MKTKKAKKETYKKMYIDINEIMKGAKKTNIFKDIQKEFLSEKHDDFVRESNLKQAQAWSILGHQVVGAEVL